MRGSLARLGLALLLMEVGWGVAIAAPRADCFSRELAARRRQFEEAKARPEAVVPLLGVIHLWDDLADRAPLLRFLDDAKGSPHALPEVRARAAYLRALLQEHEGHRAEAQRAFAALGLIGRYWILGPFDNEGSAGHAEVYPPERELARAIDPKQHYSGKVGAISWRALPELSIHGAVQLDAVLSPHRFASVYATSLVRSARDVRVAVRVGSAGPIKVWVNGRLTIDHDVRREAHFDEDVAPARLRAGPNRITVKLSAADGPLTFLLRLSAPDGGPFPGLSESADFAHAKGLKEAAVGALGRVVDLRRMLAERARHHPHDAEALRDAGLYEHFVPSSAPRHRLAAELLARAAALSDDPRGYAEWAAAEVDGDARRRALESGLAAAHERGELGAGRARLDVALAKIYYAARQERRAERLLEDALHQDPSYYPATLELAKLTADRGLLSAAAAMLDELARSCPALRVWRAQAALAVRRGRREDAAALYEKISAVDRDDSDALHELYELARDRGAWKSALALLDRLSAARPDLTRLLVERAQLLEGVGRLDAAEQTITAAISLTPEDPELLERDGKLLHRLGHDRQAVARLVRALGLRPQNPELRAFLARVAPRAVSSDLARAYAVPVRPLIARAPPPRPGEPERVLLDFEATRVHDNGLSEVFHERVVQVLDERGERDAGEVAIRYTPDTQSVELRRARVYKADGSVAEAVSTGDHDLSEPWYGLYYDERAEVVELPALAVGDVVDVEYVVADNGRRNLFGDYFGDLYYFQEDVPRLESRYVLIAPSDRQLYFNRPRLGGLEQTVTKAQGHTVYTFVARRVKKISSEPNMPGYSDVAAYLHVSTFRSWSAVAAFYRGLIKGQLDPDAAIARAATEAVRGLSDERARIRAIYDLVVTQTRYVGLEFGIHGWKPYRVSQVFARKFGDCKDKASLLVTMLRQVGVEASLALARTRHNGSIDAEPASLAPFDHAIVYVPKYAWFLDGTAEFSGADELPPEDQDIPVLIVSTGQLRRTPMLPATRNRRSRILQVALAPNGAARVTEQLLITGSEAERWRQLYQAPDGRVERYSRAWNAQFPGTRVERVAMPHLGALEQPVTVEAQVEVPDWGRPEGAGGLALWALGHEPELQSRYARLSERKLDLLLSSPFIEDERVEVKLPPSTRVQRLPAACFVDSRFGHFRMRVEERGDTVAVSGALEIDAGRVAPADYGAFRRFVAKVDEAVGQQLIVAPIPTRAESP